MKINIDQQTFEKISSTLNINDLPELDRKLYLISLYIDYKKKEKEIGYEKDFIIYSTIKFKINNIINNEYNIILDNINYNIDDHKRIMTFIVKDKQFRRFIYNNEILNSILLDNKIYLFDCSDKTADSDSDNSQLSEISQQSIINCYINNEIITIKKIKSKFMENLSTLFGSINEYREKLSNLSLNLKYYDNSIQERKIYYIDAIHQYGNNSFILYFLNNQYSNVLFFSGVKGCGKTIRLLFLSYIIYLRKSNKNPRLYIDYKLITNNKTLQKLFFKRELLFLFHDFEKLKKFLELGIYKEINNYNNIFKFLIHFLTQYFESEFREKKFFLIIDNFDDEKDEEKDINDLIDFCKKNFDKVALIISGTGKFMRKKRNFFHINDNSTQKEKYLECPLYECDNDSDKNTLPEYIYISAKNYFKYKSNITDINNFSNKMLNEEKAELDKWDFYGKYFCLVNENVELKRDILNKYWDIIPSYHLIFTQKSNKICFKFQNSLIRTAFKKSIEYEVKKQSLKELLNSYNCESIEQGIYEEKLLTLLLQFNKVKINNLLFSEENMLEVEELYQFIISKYERYSGELINNKPIIITQNNFRGKFYDILILIPINDKGDYDAIFIQIGLNKTKQEVMKLENDINQNKSKYIKGIKKYVGKDINDIYLVFIFDKDTQEKKIDLYDSCSKGVEYCIKNYIKFYLFSLDDFFLYEKKDNSDSYEKVEDFTYKIQNKNILGKKRPESNKRDWYGLENIFDNDVLEALINEKKEFENLKKINIFKCKFSSKLLKKNKKAYILLFNKENYDIFLIINGNIKQYTDDKKFVEIDEDINTELIFNAYQCFFK